MISNVRIGAKNYIVSVTEHDEVFWENDDIEGFIDYSRSRIVLKPNSPDAVKETMLHEILHGLFENTGIDTEVDAERIVRLLTPRLHAFLKDNPGFQEALTSV